ncbi:DUF444 family protein [Shigella boydii]|uniref:DUF444 family protein n=1 Tax=Shigella boydii TaxID=621 RepID=UPI00093BF538|nr:DUF444 family protein [Shigella boydii]
MGRRWGVAAGWRRALDGLFVRLAIIWPCSAAVLLGECCLRNVFAELFANFVRVFFVSLFFLRSIYFARRPGRCRLAVVFWLFFVCCSFAVSCIDLVKLFFIVFFLFFICSSADVVVVWMWYPSAVIAVGEHSFFLCFSTGGTLVSRLFPVLCELLMGCCKRVLWRLCGVFALDGDRWAVACPLCLGFVVKSLLPVFCFLFFIAVICRLPVVLLRDCGDLLCIFDLFSMPLLCGPSAICLVFLGFFVNCFVTAMD